MECGTVSYLDSRPVIGPVRSGECQRWVSGYLPRLHPLDLGGWIKHCRFGHSVTLPVRHAGTRYIDLLRGREFVWAMYECRKQRRR